MPTKILKRKRKKKSRYHRGEYTSCKSGQVFKFRSGWEHKYMEYLDSLQDVESWSYEKLVIQYISNKKTGKLRKYYPDFYVVMKDGTKLVIEIKQKRKLDQATVKKKTKAAEVWCLTNRAVYKILTEIELKDLGLI